MSQARAQSQNLSHDPQFQIGATRGRRTFSENTIRYFEELTHDPRNWEAKVSSFVEYTSEFLSTTIRPGSRILLFGCPAWEVLDRVQPTRGVGVHLSRHLAEHMRKRNTNPHLEFMCASPEDCILQEKFDYVILLHQTELTEDVFSLMDTVKRFLHEDSVLIISRTNPIWRPLVRLAGAAGIRIPFYRMSFFSDESIRSSLEAKGFRIQGEYNRQIIPKRLPGISKWLNVYLGRLPFLHRLGFVKYTFAKLAPLGTPGTPRLSCSVIIPCYNEEGNIRECATRVPIMGAWTEVIIVDDGSRDRTASIAKELSAKHPHIRSIQSQKNEGKGKAVMKGLRAATGDLIFILDADMTVPPEELPDFFDAIAFGAADFVSGTRFVYNMEESAMRITNYLGNIFFSKLVQIIIGTVCTDTLCGTKVMKRKDFTDMTLDDSSWGDFDFIFHAARRKLKSLQIPVHYKSRKEGKSKMKALSAGAKFLSSCLRSWRRIG